MIYYIFARSKYVFKVSHTGLMGIRYDTSTDPEEECEWRDSEEDAGEVKSIHGNTDHNNNNDYMNEEDDDIYIYTDPPPEEKYVLADLCIDSRFQ